MGIFSRIKSKQGAVGVEPSATSSSSNFLIAAARVQSAHYPSHVRKASLDIAGIPRQVVVHWPVQYGGVAAARAVQSIA